MLRLCCSLMIFVLPMKENNHDLVRGKCFDRNDDHIGGFVAKLYAMSDDAKEWYEGYSKKII